MNYSIVEFRVEIFDAKQPVEHPFTSSENDDTTTMPPHRNKKQRTLSPTNKRQILTFVDGQNAKQQLSAAYNHHYFTPIRQRIVNRSASLPQLVRLAFVGPQFRSAALHRLDAIVASGRLVCRSSGAAERHALDLLLDRFNSEEASSCVALQLSWSMLLSGAGIGVEERCRRVGALIRRSVGSIRRLWIGFDRPRAVPSSFRQNGASILQWSRPPAIGDSSLFQHVLGIFQAIRDVFQHGFMPALTDLFIVWPLGSTGAEPPLTITQVFKAAPRISRLYIDSWPATVDPGMLAQLIGSDALLLDRGGHAATALQYFGMGPTLAERFDLTGLLLLLARLPRLQRVDLCRSTKAIAKSMQLHNIRPSALRSRTECVDTTDRRVPLPRKRVSGSEMARYLAYVHATVHDRRLVIGDDSTHEGVWLDALGYHDSSRARRLKNCASAARQYATEQCPADRSRLRLVVYDEFEFTCRLLPLDAAPILDEFARVKLVLPSSAVKSFDWQDTVGKKLGERVDNCTIDFCKAGSELSANAYVRALRRLDEVMTKLERCDLALSFQAAQFERQSALLEEVIAKAARYRFRLKRWHVYDRAMKRCSRADVVASACYERDFHGIARVLRDEREAGKTKDIVLVFVCKRKSVQM